MTTEYNNLPTGLELVNALDGVSQQRLAEIIAELRNAAANEDNGNDQAKLETPVKKEPVLEI